MYTITVKFIVKRKALGLVMIKILTTWQQQTFQYHMDLMTRWATSTDINKHMATAQFYKLQTNIHRMHVANNILWAWGSSELPLWAWGSSELLLWAWGSSELQSYFCDTWPLLSISKWFGFINIFWGKFQFYPLRVHDTWLWQMRFGSEAANRVLIIGQTCWLTIESNLD